jgi:hypothetical protein
MTTLREIKDALAVARQRADRQVRKFYDYKFTRARHVIVATYDNYGGCNPCQSGDALPWNGTLKELQKIIEQVTTDPRYLLVEGMSLSAMYEGADSLRDANDGGAEPLDTAFEVEVWRRGEGLKAEIISPAETLTQSK